ncbi:MAG: hypothetical protein HYY04_03055 [Chloroflexi bacterium]|nr:hypothetical protein [Chloroflexota bacterium]
MSGWTRRGLARLALPVALALAALSVALVSTRPVAARQAADTTTWQQGVSFSNGSPSVNTSSSYESLARLKVTGANFVVPTIVWLSDDSAVAECTSTNIVRGSSTVSDADLVAFIRNAHTLGLQVALKPHVEYARCDWRGHARPSDVDAWFAAYREMINGYAALAEQEGVEVLVVGSEYVSLSGSDYTARWQTVISEVRQRYRGKLTYNANWGAECCAEEFPRIEFWPSLDYLGISAYFELGTYPDPSNANCFPTVDQLIAAWTDVYQRKIEPFQRQYGKPLLFTEIGYHSTPCSAVQPWRSDLPVYQNNVVDLQVQVNLYEALFRFWGQVPWFAGVYLWYWHPNPDAGGSSDPNYTPQNKPAQVVMMRSFGGGYRTALPAIARASSAGW